MRTRCARLGVVLVALLLAATSAAADEPRAVGPRLSTERIVLRTIAGDLAIALYPEVAPGHTAQLLRLARLRIWATTHFHRIHPDFVAQLSSAEDRTEPFTDEQRAAIQPILGEFSTLPHRRGIISMAHPDGEPDGARTSFSILLGTAPHLDGKYSIVGEVVDGMDVLDRLAEVPAPPPTYRPPIRMRILGVDVYDTPAAYADARLAAAHAVFPRGLGEAPPVVGPASSAGARDRTAADLRSGARTQVLLLLVLAMMALGIAQALLRARLEARSSGSIGLLIALVAALALLVLVDPASGTTGPYVGALFFVGLIGLFRLLAARFES